VLPLASSGGRVVVRLLMHRLPRRLSPLALPLPSRVTRDDRVVVMVVHLPTLPLLRLPLPPALLLPSRATLGGHVAVVVVVVVLVVRLRLRLLMHRPLRPQSLLRPSRGRCPVVARVTTAAVGSLQDQHQDQHRHHHLLCPCRSCPGPGENRTKLKIYFFVIQNKHFPLNNRLFVIESLANPAVASLVVATSDAPFSAAAGSGRTVPVLAEPATSAECTGPPGFGFDSAAEPSGDS
jgi:hypothetical protein